MGGHAGDYCRVGRQGGCV